MSYQEKMTGNQLYYLFGLSVLLVYLCLAGQYESWILPLAVLSAVPLALLGPVVALTSLGVANNLYTQIGLMLMIALSAKNGILIVEMAREGRIVHGKPILEAAVERRATRFRPILMTSFAFILGVLPLVLATGAGANARISLGLSVFSGMIASTCLAVLFVPSFFAVLQRFEEWRKRGSSRRRVVALIMVSRPPATSKRPTRNRLHGAAATFLQVSLFRQRLVDQGIDKRPIAHGPLKPGTWTMKTAAKSSFGSAHQSVPHAPFQWKSPALPMKALAPSRTATQRPKP